MFDTEVFQTRERRVGEYRFEINMNARRLRPAASCSGLSIIPTSYVDVRLPRLPVYDLDHASAFRSAP